MKKNLAENDDALFLEYLGTITFPSLLGVIIMSEITSAFLFQGSKVSPRSRIL